MFLLVIAVEGCKYGKFLAAVRPSWVTIENDLATFDLRKEMLTKQPLTLLLAGVGTLVLATSASANLVANGGFESVSFGSANSSGTGYWVFNAGNTGISSWTIGAVSVDIVNSVYPVYAGSYALDLVGTPGPGGVSQTLATTNGLTHTVNFKARWTGSTLNQSVRVTLGAAPTQTVVLGAANTWHDVTVNFAAVSGNSNLFTLATLANNNGNGNTFIDEVNVNPVPEPFTMALAAGGLALPVRRRRRA